MPTLDSLRPLSLLFLKPRSPNGKVRLVGCEVPLPTGSEAFLAKNIYTPPRLKDRAIYLTNEGQKLLEIPDGERLNKTQEFSRGRRDALTPQVMGYELSFSKIKYLDLTRSFKNRKKRTKTSKSARYTQFNIDYEKIGKLDIFEHHFGLPDSDTSTAKNPLFPNVYDIAITPFQLLLPRLEASYFNPPVKGTPAFLAEHLYDMAAILMARPDAAVFQDFVYRIGEFRETGPARTALRPGNPPSPYEPGP